MKQDENISRFVGAARRFCTLLETRHRSKRRFLGEILRATVALYHAGLALPEVGPEPHYSPLGEWGEANKHLPIAEKIKLDPQLREYSQRRRQVLKRVVSNLGGELPYREVFKLFDPDDGPVTASISDDLADIYCNLQQGLATLTDSRRPSTNVVWQWKFDLESHWGRQATSAVRALHVLAFCE